MAKDVKKDPQDLSVEEKLKALYQLQTMLSEIDKIKTLRGELPLEVQDLEDEVTGLTTRIEKINKEIAELKENVTTKKNEISEAQVPTLEEEDAFFLRYSSMDGTPSSPSFIRVTQVPPSCWKA